VSRTNDSIRDEVAALRRDGLERCLRCAEPSGPGRMRIGGREALVLSSNDYLGLAGDERLAAAARAALSSSGAGGGAARLLTGTRREHLDLEEEVVRLTGAPAALTFASGYAGNLAVLGALFGPGDLVVSDELNHASLVDGMRLSGVERRVVPHRDVAAVRDALRDARRHRRVAIVTEGVFSMDGDVAPLADLLTVAREHDVLLVVDDAHGFGVLGATGGGAVEAAGIADAPDVVRVGTFGKAFGAAGAFLAADADVVTLVLNRGRAFFFSTAPAPAIAAASRAGVRVAREEPKRRERCLAVAARLATGLRERGVSVALPTAAIVPVVIGDTARAVACGQRLLSEHGILAPAIRPPTVPEGTSRLRLSASAAHTDEDVDRAAAAVAEVLG
jgi:8-amino-7-oxononanoate synthase